MDWIQELDDLVQDLLMEALTVELCRAALAGCAPRLAQFPPQALSGLLSRSGSFLTQRAWDLRPGARAAEEIAAALTAGSATAPG